MKQDNCFLVKYKLIILLNFKETKLLVKVIKLLVIKKLNN